MIYKKWIVALLFIFMLLTPALAQENTPGENDEPRFLFSDKEMKVNGFGGPFVLFSQMEGDFAVMTGGGGAALVNNTFYLGGYGAGLASRHKREDYKNMPDLYTELGHGGLWMGYNIAANKIMHLTVSVKAGIGGLSLSADDLHTQHDNLKTDLIYAFMPEAGLEVNIAPWFKLNAGAGYHYLTGTDGETYPTETSERVAYQASDYTTPYFNLTFIFGWFK